MENLSLPVDHLSYSAVRLFCSNQQQFLKNYVLGLWDFKLSVTGAVGKGFHKAMEHYYKTGDYNTGVEIGYQYLNKMNGIDFGKTSSRESMLKTFHKATQFYRQEEPDWGKVIGVEKKITTDKGFNDEVLPLPIKAVSDLVCENGKDLIIADYKVVSSFTDKGDVQPDYIMQAIFNFITVRAKYGRDPKKMIFCEIKPTQNRDGKPQLEFYEIDFEKEKSEMKHFEVFTHLYNDVLHELGNPNKRYIPNFADYFSGKESWEDYVNEKIVNVVPDGEISYKSVMTKDLREVKFVESVLDSNQTLSDEDKIKAKLMEFGIAVEMVDTHRGKNVTLFTMRTSRGISMSAFKKHSDDLSLALEAKSVRVQAPIPGTSFVGVEVSNSHQEIAKWNKNLLRPNSLKIPVGVDVYNKTCYLDLTKAPHLLIGGTTGSGKSVFMNVLINSLVNQTTPDYMKLVLIDPKRTEFLEYEDAPHLLADIITEGDDAMETLDWAVETMETRYFKLKQMRVKTIQEYRENANDMPYIVIVIDELADLMLSSDHREAIEKSIVRLAQKARAVGIHLVAATQRPSVDVITGLIKANFPTRVSFMVSSQVDSRVVLDDTGAEKLLGNGDLLFMNPRNQGLERLQGYFIN